MSAILPLYPLENPMPKALANAPIGIFDSGIGGLSIAQEIAHYLPNERIVYYADTAHVPYGPRTDQNIRELTAQAIEWLYRQGCKIAVVACNTASAFSLDYLREHYGENFPIVGLVPALKPAVLQSQSKVVSVLATPATFRGQLIKDVIQRFAEPAQVEVLTITNLDLVPLVESGRYNTLECKQSLQKVLDPAVAKGADYLVLGCTHYPYLKQSIQELYGAKLSLIDSGLAVARQTARILLKNELISTDSQESGVRLRCFVSGQNAKELESVLKHLIQPEITWSIENIVEKLG
ncbi:glutamate racemase [Acinetobacter bereziniae]|jgi:glutamate racemase|uniref:Glutamate racemase n=1 Tax=Acinetobacter bereziniae LMG 1003 = CIP 70.12 TaxID=981324 RepID=N9CZF7_ACIBZ|nr:glutamate racemase [Acinetobacter bereziniae]ATZ62195.1 glutamate racemase [Acinetobacter bereziniae]ENV91272.1 glutamate racemase [Acinetobacter bereziniae LMG 1003 = CIP 70.12]MBJ8422976.1 glutamate racemase [Acinetobacter bereziniae]MBJ8444332.1 glutamate racemase [Acinetobacter bereziniae]MBJ9902522.1 glutamate racemase [Acinetobacter bereziniae]